MNDVDIRVTVVEKVINIITKHLIYVFILFDSGLCKLILLFVSNFWN